MVNISYFDMEHLIESHKNINPFIYSAEELIESAEKPSAEKVTKVFRELCHGVEANLNDLTQFDIDRIRAIVDQYKETQKQVPFIVEPHLAQITALLNSRQNRGKAEKADIPKSSIDDKSDVLTEAINKAEQAVEQYQNYLNAGQDDSETAEHPRPSDERMVDVFSELQNEVSSNLSILNVNEFYRVISIAQKFLGIFNELRMTTSDLPDLLISLNEIFTLLQARKEAGQLFEGKEGTA